MCRDCRAEQAILSAAEAYRLVDEAREMRMRSEMGEDALLRVTAERDSALALTAARLLEIAALRGALENRSVAQGVDGFWCDECKARRAVEHKPTCILARPPDQAGAALLQAVDALLAKSPCFPYIARIGADDIETCQFCGMDNGHADTCEWMALKRARAQAAVGEGEGTG